MDVLDEAADGAVLVVGEALVDVVDRSSLDGPGDAAVERHVGGSPANVALGLARLGHRVAFATRIGRDADGARICAKLEGDGVRLVPGALVDDATATATATLDATGQASYAFDLRWELPAVELAGVQHLHSGSIAATLAPGATRVRDAFAAARAAGATTSYDPNVRPALMAAPEQERPGVERLVARSDVVKASDEDLAWLYPDQSPDEAAQAWAALGPQLVVVTRGEHGATAFRAHAPGVAVPVAPRPVEVVDTVGAGDAFMAGLVSGLLDAGLLGGERGRRALQDAAPEPVLQALARAVLAASLTCGRRGAEPPTRDELRSQREIDR